MLRFLTAGESHGKGIIGIIEGLPADIPIDTSFIDFHLRRRQAGYGRGARMKIESDRAEIISGVRLGKTTGSPVSVLIKNKDWENWTEIMAVEDSGELEPERITIPRPGHADTVGSLKYNFDDIRNSIERSSARETAARVAVCTFARKFLEAFNIKIGSWVENIGGIYPADNFGIKVIENNVRKNFDAWKIAEKADKSSVRVLDKIHEEKIISGIKKAKKNGDTLGGTFYIAATGLPAGLGSFIQYDRKLNADLAHALMSVNAVKAVEFGLGFESGNVPGSQAHDEIIIKNNKILRKTNRSGGIEGGISTGMPLLIRAAMKPIATLMKPLQSIDLDTKRSVKSRRERSDFVAVPACAIIGESMTAFVLAKYFLEKFGGDSLGETLRNYRNFNDLIDAKLNKSSK